MSFQHAHGTESDDAGKVEITARILRETEKALLIEDGVTHQWLPRSKITVRPCPGAADHVEILMPEWLARDKGYL